MTPVHQDDFNGSRHPATSILRGQPADPMSFSEQAASFVGKTAGMLWRGLQHLVSLALAAIGGAIVAACTLIDLIYKLVTEGIPRLGRMALTLLRSMARLINDGWESAKAATSDTYYQSKQVIYYVLERFMVKMRQYYLAAMSAARSAITTGGDAIRRVTPIIGIPALMFF